ncbi:hypothetical protein SY2F82_07980 [Streptomyces sp. Y2F8-2]|nr:hypothetical protein SY2F82_07980 [Streptomyces sp. Y2F8-2]
MLWSAPGARIEPRRKPPRQWVFTYGIRTKKAIYDGIARQSVRLFGILRAYGNRSRVPEKNEAVRMTDGLVSPAGR